MGGSYECGVFRGFKSDFLLTRHKDFLETNDAHLFDTFEGIDLSYSEGSPIAPAEHAKRNLYEFVVERFKTFPNCYIHKGTVPHTLYDVNIDRCCFLHLDMNSWQAEIKALEFFLPIMEFGSVIVLDDYGLKTHSAQAEKETPFLSDKGIRVLELPTGQGIIIK